MFEDLYPDTQEFLEAFSSVGEYDPDQAVYKYLLESKDKSEVELYFSINDLSTTIHVKNPTGGRITSFYSEFVKFIRINKLNRSIFFSIESDNNSSQTALIRVEDSATLEIVALKK